MCAWRGLHRISPSLSTGHRRELSAVTTQLPVARFSAASGRSAYWKLAVNQTMKNPGRRWMDVHRREARRHGGTESLESGCSGNDTATAATRQVLPGECRRPRASRGCGRSDPRIRAASDGLRGSYPRIASSASPPTIGRRCARTPMRDLPLLTVSSCLRASQRLTRLALP
jgi:hypothetical protein